MAALTRTVPTLGRSAGPPWGAPIPGNEWSRLDGVGHAGRSVSVIVLHHRQPRELARTLAALGGPRLAAVELEIVVVDDGSPECPRVPPGVRLVRLPRRGARRSAARNAGAAASRGELLVFLDADTTPEPDFVLELTRLVSLAPEAVTVGRRRHAELADVAAEVPVAAAGPDHELTEPAWLIRGYTETRDLRRPGARGFRFVLSAVLAMSRWFFDEVGGFDERFDAYGGEDWELGLRAWRAGALLAHVPTAVAWHDGPAWEHRTDGSADERRRDKNAEARRLAALLPIAGHRAHGLLGRRAECVIAVPDRLGPDERFVTVDSLVAALPGAAFRGADSLREDFGPDRRLRPMADDDPDEFVAWPGLHLEVVAGVEVTGPELAERCQGLLDADGGRVTLADADGPLLVLETGRQRIRRERWGPAAEWAATVEHPSWLRRLPVPCDVEAYLGGWSR